MSDPGDTDARREREPVGDAGLTEAQREWERDSERHGPNFSPVDPPAPRLVLIGAVELSAAVCAAARPLGWSAYVVDPRARFTTRERFPDATGVLVDWPAGAFASLGGCDARTGVVALAHAPEVDDPALAIALRSPAFYVGALGSRRTQGRRRERLAAAGFTAAELDRLAGPAGLDLGGETVGEAALAIVAEAVAARRGRGGGPLSASANAIHTGDRP